MELIGAFSAPGRALAWRDPIRPPVSQAVKKTGRVARNRRTRPMRLPRLIRSPNPIAVLMKSARLCAGHKS
jgi:hypothetical protein